MRDDRDTGDPTRSPFGPRYALPSYPYEVPIAIQDRSFAADGQLVYPSDPVVPSGPVPSIQQQAFGDVILVNGQAWPKLDVEPRRYRLRC